MSNGVYTDYFQKSKVFLYPLLRIKKNVPFTPAETYICWDGVYDVNDFKFLCVYNTEMDEKFKSFESNLKGNVLFEEYHKLSDDTHLYIFDFTPFKRDFDSFVKGKYSKFTKISKDTIEEFFGNNGKIASFVTAFLFPDIYHAEYAKALNVPMNVIESVYELCNKPDLDKETLYEKLSEVVDLLNEVGISLDQNQKPT
jgi:hypothetical protein